MRNSRRGSCIAAAVLVLLTGNAGAQSAGASIQSNTVNPEMFVSLACRDELRNVVAAENSRTGEGYSIYMSSRSAITDPVAIDNALAEAKTRVARGETQPPRGYFMLCVLSARAGLTREPSQDAIAFRRQWRAVLRPGLEAETGVRRVALVEDAPDPVPGAGVSPPTAASHSNAGSANTVLRDDPKVFGRGVRP